MTIVPTDLAPVLSVGHFSRVLLVYSCQAPKGKPDFAKSWFCATRAASGEYQGSEMDEDVQSLLQKHRFRQAFERLLAYTR